jgi:hypothetical protein
MQGGYKNCIQNFSQKLQGKIPLWRPKHGWEGNIKIHIKEIGYEGVNWIELAQDRF